MDDRFFWHIVMVDISFDYLFFLSFLLFIFVLYYQAMTAKGFWLFDNQLTCSKWCSYSCPPPKKKKKKIKIKTGLCKKY